MILQAQKEMSSTSEEKLQYKERVENLEEELAVCRQSVVGLFDLNKK